jgi:hypothetical protein
MKTALFTVYRLVLLAATPRAALADERGAAAGVVTGAVAGALVGGPVGAVIGAAVGGVVVGTATSQDALASAELAAASGDPGTRARSAAGAKERRPGDAGPGDDGVGRRDDMRSGRPREYEVP